jgi:predicted Zn-dependent protease
VTLLHHLAGDVGAEVSIAEAATRLDGDSPAAWSTYAHALARTDRITECLKACRRALELGEDPEVADLLARFERQSARVLSERSAA